MGIFRPSTRALSIVEVGTLLAVGVSASSAWNSGLAEFFRSVDSDGDGQIEPSEAMRYIGDSFGTELPEKDRKLAVQQMSRNLDGSDSGVTVSKAEVEQHLRTLLKVRGLSEHCQAEWSRRAGGCGLVCCSAGLLTAKDSPSAAKA